PLATPQGARRPAPTPSTSSSPRSKGYASRRVRFKLLHPPTGGSQLLQLFRRKPIADLARDGEDPNALKRELGAGDLIMLAIGAVIGAGIFGAIGTAAAGEVLPSGEVVRLGAGPGLIVSFVLLGVVCALAALCYAELASMIPQAGSAYAYSYA